MIYFPLLTAIFVTMGLLRFMTKFPTLQLLLLWLLGEPPMLEKASAKPLARAIRMCFCERSVWIFTPVACFYRPKTGCRRNMHPKFSQIQINASQSLHMTSELLVGVTSFCTRTTPPFPLLLPSRWASPAPSLPSPEMVKDFFNPFSLWRPGWMKTIMIQPTGVKRKMVLEMFWWSPFSFFFFSSILCGWLRCNTK